MRPSLLPALAKCPRYESGGGNAFTEAGQSRHAALRKRLAREPDPMAGLPDDDADAVARADFVELGVRAYARKLRRAVIARLGAKGFVVVPEEGMSHGLEVCLRRDARLK